jgi:hypothetical protein
MFLTAIAFGAVDKKCNHKEPPVYLREENTAMTNTLKVLLVAGLTFGTGGALGVPSASAMPIAHYSIPAAAAAYQPAAWVYVSSKHGHRYKAKRSGFNFYYGGYWYAQPWWTIGVGPVIVYSPAIHGPRYHAKRSGYVYFHNGYWYKRRWW